MKRSLLMGVAASMAVLSLTGCGGEKTSEVTAVTVDKEGHVSNVIYEQFDKDYYDLEELSKMAEEEVAEYNNEYMTPKITLDKVEAAGEEGNYVRVSMNYDSATDYSNFNEETLFYGTIEEAEAAGYKVSGELVNDKGEKIDSSFAKDHPERHIIITNDKANIITPYNIEYMTKGVSLVGKKEAKLSNSTAESIQLLLSK